MYDPFFFAIILMAMFFVGLFIFELFILYLLTHNIYTLFFRLFYRITRNRDISTKLLAFLFLPGTFFHELAHWLTAIILFVPARAITLFPKMNDGGSLQLGSVSIAKTDIVRRFIIGAAPILFGVSLILSVLYFAFKNNFINDYLMIFLLGYFIFEVGNTMFSSKKDMEGALGLFLTIFVTSFVLYFLGSAIGIYVDASVVINFFSKHIMLDIFSKGSLYLLIPIIIDLIFITILKVIHGGK
jgi:hypothetical protein